MHNHILVFDRSGSMIPISDWEHAIADYLGEAEHNPNLNTALLDFHKNTVRLIKPFTTDFLDTKPDILTSEAAGPTPLTDALRHAFLLAENTPDTHITIITDGYPNHPEQFTTLLNTHNTDATIHLIAIEDDPSTPSTKLPRELFSTFITVPDSSTLYQSLSMTGTLLTHCNNKESQTGESPAQHC